MTAVEDLKQALALLDEHRKVQPGLGGIEFLVKQAYGKLTREDSRKWFHDRIGKIVFREDNGCGCASCTEVLKNGVKIQDNVHADYLCDSSAEMGIKYSDNKI